MDDRTHTDARFDRAVLEILHAPLAPPRIEDPAAELAEGVGAPRDAVERRIEEALHEREKWSAVARAALTW